MVVHFMLGVMLISVMLDWLSFILFAISGFAASYGLLVILNGHITFDLLSVKMNYYTFYLLFFISLIGILFSKPKNLMKQQLRMQNKHIKKLVLNLKNLNQHKQNSIEKLKNLRQEILQNISHEIKPRL